MIARSKLGKEKEKDKKEETLTTRSLFAFGGNTRIPVAFARFHRQDLRTRVLLC